MLTSRFVLGLAILLFAAPALASARRGGRCPHFITQDGDDADAAPDHVPTVPARDGSGCVLKRDVKNLLATLELESGMSLDCGGHKITPASRGVSGNAASRSVPELALFLHEVSDVHVQNCVVEGFDHGIFAANNKALASGPPTSSIVGNTIDARFVALHLTASDRFLIEDNTLSWRTRGGAAIFAHFDSDQNVVRGNLILGDFDASTQGAVLFPGPASPSNPVFPSGPAGHAAVLVVQTLGPHPHLFNALIGGRLYQFEDEYHETPTEAFSGDNLIEGNDVTFCRENLTEDAIVASNTLRTTVAHNTVGRAISEDCAGGGERIAIRAGSIHTSLRYPGTCVGKPARRCLGDVDCNLPSIDDPAVADRCGPVPSRNAIWYPVDFTAVGNTILPPFQNAIATSGFLPVIEKNDITGPLRQSSPQQPLSVFVIEGKQANDTAIVTENQVRDVSTLPAPPAPRPASIFYLFRSAAPNAIPADGYRAQISLNNLFPGYQVAVRTSDDFNFAAELSLDGRGNYWGLSCDPLAFDPTKVVKQNNTLNPLVVDSHPFGEPVSESAAEPCDAP